MFIQREQPVWICVEFYTHWARKLFFDFDIIYIHID